MRVKLSSLAQHTQKEPCSGPMNGTAPNHVYSGYLLKLGSNNRWQSRLFTFDGSVLECIGKKLRKPTIVTYDPHVSSPFVAASVHPQQTNPNAKWFIDISTVVDINLLPATRSFRCFPPINTTKQLHIRTSDGRNQFLRATKDAELERWYFVLSKIWEHHPHADRTDAVDTRNLAAHQQSKQLFEKYLQKHQDDNQELSPSTEQEQQQQKEQHQSAQQLPYHLRPLPRETRYQLPPAPRLSAFLPHGFDWRTQEPGSKPETLLRPSSTFHDAQSGAGVRERRLPVRQTSWSHQLQVSASMTAGIRQNRELIRSSSAGVVHNHPGYPAAGSMEPGKVAIIDNWRRSLLSPLSANEAAVSEHRSSGSSMRMSPVPHELKIRAEECTTSVSPSRTVSQNMESTFGPSSLGIDDARFKVESSRKTGSQGTSPLTDDKTLPRHFSQWYLSAETQVGPQPQNVDIAIEGLGQAAAQRRFSHHGENDQRSQQRLSYLLQNEGRASALQHDHYNQENTEQHLANPAESAQLVAKQEDELPLGLIQANRHSRWLNTQLSSDDEASVTQHALLQPIDIQARHKLLPSGPITPEQAPSKESHAVHQPFSSSNNEGQIVQRSLMVNQRNPSFRNSTLTLHGYPQPLRDSFFSPNDHPSDTCPSSESLHTTEDKNAATATAMASISTAPLTNRPPFSVQAPVRQLRRYPSMPVFSIVTGAPDPSNDRYMTVDTNSYNNTAITQPDHPTPPLRLTRPTCGIVSPLATPEEPTSAACLPLVRTSISHHSSLAQETEMYMHQQYQQRRPSLSRSISAMSSVSQVQAHRAGSYPRGLVTGPGHGGDDDSDYEDEPLAMTLSRQQSSRQLLYQQQQHHHHPVQQQQQQQHWKSNTQPSLSPSSTNLLNKNRHSMHAIDSRSRRYDHAAMVASSESFNYF